MPIDLKSLKKMETAEPSVQASPPDSAARLVVLVKLAKGAEKPDYLSPRAEIGPGIFSAEIEAGELERLESDPAIESVSLPRTLPGMK